MERILNSKGQSLIEMLFAVSVFTIGVVTIGYLIFDSFASLRYAQEVIQARLLASEGLEAVRSLYEEDFALLVNGTHGLSLQNGAWDLASTTEEIGKFQRSIIIEETDPEVKSVTAAVFWGGAPREKSYALTTVFTNWQQQSGDAADLEIDVNNVSLTASGTVLSNIALRNIGVDDVMLTHITGQWDGSATVSSMVIRSTEVMTASTTPPASSGDTIDIADYTVGSASGYHLIDSMTFSEDMTDTDLLFSFVLEDGSKKHARISW